MRLKSFVIIFVLSIFPFIAFAWDDKVTHKDLSEVAAKKSVLGITDCLKNIGLNGGLFQRLKLNTKEQALYNWIREGAELEDEGSLITDVPRGRARFNNHFHHPLKSWASAGLNDMQTGESSLLWAQDSTKQASAIGGDWSWSQIRGFYLRALTSATGGARQAYFAQTFRGLGQQMHLIQDAAVPAHVRNDAHPLDATMHYHAEFVGQYFESWAKENSSKINSFATNTIISPTVVFGVSHYDPTLDKDLVPITQLIDTDQYTGMNPSASLSIGLAEYTNANFFSDDTIFAAETYAADQKHFSPFPRQNSTNLQSLLDQSLLPEVVIAFDGKPDVGFWIQKVRDGESTINHFVKPTYTWMKLLKKIQVVGPVYLRSFYIDEMCNEDYARLLIPRAVGYSAALLNYFFRGQINLQPDEDDPSHYVISNDSDEPLHGTFNLYYDDKTGNRKLYKTSLISSGVATVEAHSTSDPVTFSDPTDAQSPGTYMLVFQGTMGNENGAVVGRVVKLKKIEITAPDRCLFAITDGAKMPQQFTTIKAKVRPANLEGTIQSGALQAIAKFKNRTDYQPDLSTDPPTTATTATDFTFKSSATITLTTDDISALNSGTPKEFLFDFSGSPIPAGITDLSLITTFTGTVVNASGTPSAVTAVGTHDVSEPMHINVWNDTDRFYLYGTLYPASDITSSQPLLQLVDHDNNGSPDEPIDPFKMAFRVTYCPSSTNYTAQAIYNSVSPGTYGRMIVITDSNQNSFPVSIQWNPIVYTPDLPGDTENYELLDYVTITKNQEENDQFTYTPVYPHRNVLGHISILHYQSYPMWMGLMGGAWPDLPANTPAVPASGINP